MPIPFDISYRDIELSTEVDDHIRERAEKLEHFYPRLVSIRVVVEGPGKHHKTGGKYRLKITLGVPGNDIVINHKAGEDLTAVVRDSFDAAKRKLEDHARVLRGEIKLHSGEPEALP